MRLERLQIAGFGALRDLEVEFHPGITVLQGANEAGKSTVHRCIRAMFYGLNKEEQRAWKPWNHDNYAAVLVYQLDSGQRFRVARDFSGRSSAASVTEISAGDRTDEFRVGREVLPGLLHLGVDEAVFCATAWLDDEGLRAGSVSATGNNHAQIQQALERLADSGGGVTAAEALTALDEVSRSLGTDRVSQLPMGQALLRLHQCETELENARKQAFASLEQQRLAFAKEQEAEHLDSSAREEERRYLMAKRAQLAELSEAMVQVRDKQQKLSVVLEATRGFSRFPAQERIRIVELQQQLLTAQAAESATHADWLKLEPRLHQIVARRDEIARGSLALGTPLVPAIDLLDRVQNLRGKLRSLGSPTLAASRAVASRARVLALQTELAANGFGDFYKFQLSEISDLVEGARRPAKGAALAVAVCAGMFACAFLAFATHRIWLFAPAALLLPVALFLLFRVASALAAARDAGRLLRDQFPDATTNGESWNRQLARLPNATRLKEEIAAVQLMAERDALEIEVFDQELRETVELSNQLTSDCGLEVVTTPRLSSELLTFSYAQLDRVEAVVRSSERLQEINDEDQQLVKEEADLRALEEEDQNARLKRVALETRIRQLLRSFGVKPADLIEKELQSFLQHCDGREQFEQARKEIAEIEFSVRRWNYQDAEAISKEESRLTDLISEAGLDVADCKAVDPAELHRLEVESQRLRRVAEGKLREAMELRARVQGSLQNLRSIPDIEDECQEARVQLQRLQRQKRSLVLAMETLKRVTASVHHDLAPRLAASVSENLKLITDSRWAEAFVNADTFAISLQGSDSPHLIPLDRVSHGTRDQISLLLRIALIAELSARNESVPLLLDEPFLSSDPTRRDRLVDFLALLAEKHQLLITTNEDAQARGFLEAAEGEASLHSLGGRAHALDVFGQAG